MLKRFVWVLLRNLMLVRGGEFVLGKTHSFDKAVFAKPLLCLRLFIRVRSQGAYVASVPLKRLVELSKCGFRNWRFEDGWLVLEAI